jgi:branched-chain amino acid transport system substrate-binding protein
MSSPILIRGSEAVGANLLTFDQDYLNRRSLWPGFSGRGLLLTLLLVTAGFVTACQSTNNMGLGGSRSDGFEQSSQSPTPNPNGEIIGQGPARIAMLLPQTAPGNAATAAAEVRNGARFAMQDFGNETIELIIKDTAGQTAASQSAATEAVREGSIAVLGPIFAANVSAASAITQPSGRTMVAFSADTSIAKRGVYLLSYTPQDDTRRIIRHALSGNSRSILAFLPRNAEGTLRESVLRQEAGSAGANLRVLKYERSMESIEETVVNATPILDGFDTIYIPEGNDIPNVILQTMRKQGVNVVGKQIIGSGAWESVNLAEPQLENAIYPGRDLSRIDDFNRRYEEEHGTKPTTLAALGYDSVMLVADLLSRLGPDRAFSPEGIENPRGFAGINGIFRLRSNGTAERGLAIYRVTDGEATVLEPAPQSFARGPSG